ncbi:MAG: family 20 glycosylhydrolase, partial [Verrucomicrobia bacterium]|nr:family 20 glycosylhydrolase [Verrucomicrobiota bacterium]
MGPQNCIVAHHEKLRPLAEVLAAEISLTTGLKLPVKVGEASPGDIFLALNSALKNEAHTFVVTDRAVIQGGNYGAVALGSTTLLQSLQIRDGKVFLPVMSVEDQPQTEYRGLFVDVARQYHSLSNLRQIVQLCRLYKIRYLHLHLTDDQSVMFPSQAFPKLATQNQHGGKTYTLEELKELVAFADQRGVTIIPELDVPGHSAAMNRAMRDLFM